MRNFQAAAHPRTLLAALAMLFLAGSTAAAHHGWAWTEDAPFELSGSIEEIYVGNPHVTLEVRNAEGLWHVDLAPLSRSLRAGFNEDVAAAGDEVICIGFRSRDPGSLSMKAARVIVNGETYDVYPNRVPEI